MRQKLGETSKLQWAALVVLVLAIVALLVVLFTQQQDYRTDAEAARESNVSAPATEPPAETVEPSASPSASPTASEASEEAPENAVDAVTAAAQAVVNRGDDSVINVLGDSTSNTSSEWVYRWAEELGGDAAVTVHTWNPEAGTWYVEPRTYGEGDRAITIWNGSAAEGTPGFPLELDGMIEPEADLTILNYGHWGDPESVASSLEELLNTLDAGAEDAAPVVLTAQNPAQPTWVGYADTNRDAMRAAAEERELPVINIEGAFEDSGDWESLLADEVNPNEDGHQLWAEAVSGYFAD
ncbi:SGNH/GDSL hydrolase family protein [Citricoccus sp.]|uniref:SGNH/GDSL hydrolase family protein n=1 Tax=Citricoccus sp. TaxID=1978372 RepID=UPI0028BE2868|nr:SGNH/GDSL hydrolase family protein [Citricoccus sp.]